MCSTRNGVTAFDARWHSSLRNQAFGDYQTIILYSYRSLFSAGSTGRGLNSRLRAITGQTSSRECTQYRDLMRGEMWLDLGSIALTFFEAWVSPESHLLPYIAHGI